MADNGSSNQSSRLMENPFIKPQNREWSISLPASLDAPVSPPPPKRSRSDSADGPPTSADAAKVDEDGDPTGPVPHPSGEAAAAADVSAIEAGKVDIENHFDVLAASLLQAIRPAMPSVPRLAYHELVDLYKRNQHTEGRHFVIHQHDHPVAGPHYDLRLQFSETSSMSFAIMYGLPGNANSRRINRNATETRVHTLWNHLIESASSSTGSLLIWDTGEYSVLPYYEDTADTDRSHSDVSDSSLSDSSRCTETEKLRLAFQQRKIRLRLHGTRLPNNYTVTLRLTKSNDMSEQPKRPARKRRRRAPTAGSSRNPSPPTSDEGSANQKAEDVARTPAETDPSTPPATHSDADEDENIRKTNAYPGAINSISSVHQRKWYLSLDRANSGFEKEFYRDGSSIRHRWVRQKADERDEDGKPKLLGFEPFYVRGPDVERSVVTGRLGRDIMDDEGVKGFIGRKGWRPVLE